MKPCTCGKQLDNSAKACPGCGKTFKVTSGFTQSVGACIVLFVIIGAAGAIFNPTPSAPLITSEQQADKAKEEAKILRSVAGARQLRSSMRNPDSFKLSEALVMNDGAVCYDYRAQNGFGGMNVGQAVLGANNQFKSSDSPGFTTLWNKECANKTGTDNAELIRRVLGDK